MSEYKEGVGPFAYGKNVQVPNSKKKVTDYVVKHMMKALMCSCYQMVKEWIIQNYAQHLLDQKM